MKYLYIVCRDKKVYDTEERKKFCSGTCFKASNFLRNQLDKSPLWIRKHFNCSRPSSDDFFFISNLVFRLCTPQIFRLCTP